MITAEEQFRLFLISQTRLRVDFIEISLLMIQQSLSLKLEEQLEISSHSLFLRQSDSSSMRLDMRMQSFAM